MPTYDWECTRCKRRDTTLAPIERAHIPPSDDDGDAATDCAHEWERAYIGAPGKAYADGWGSVRKGNYGRDG